MLDGINEPPYSVHILMRYKKDICTKLDCIAPHALKSVLSTLKAANVAHNGQLRKGEEPFMIHPIAVAAMHDEMRLHRDCVIAGFLHDTVEDTPFMVRSLELLFGTNVPCVVEGRNELGKIKNLVFSGNDNRIEYDFSFPSDAV